MKVNNFDLVTYMIVFQGVADETSKSMSSLYRGVGKFAGETLQMPDYEAGYLYYRYTYPYRDGRVVTDLIPHDLVKKVCTTKSEDPGEVSG